MMLMIKIFLLVWHTQYCPCFLELIYLCLVLSLLCIFIIMTDLPRKRSNHGASPLTSLWNVPVSISFPSLTLEILGRDSSCEPGYHVTQSFLTLPSLLFLLNCLYLTLSSPSLITELEQMSYDGKRIQGVVKSSEIFLSVNTVKKIYSSGWPVKILRMKRIQRLLKKNVGSFMKITFPFYLQKR